MGITAVIDYGLCNLDSVRRAVEECGGKPVVTSDARDIARASHVILPGVGAFPKAMQLLARLGLEGVIREQALGERVPFLGICLGMQLMATRGFEGGEVAGLDLVPGAVRRLVATSPSERIPHIGWNEVRGVRDCALLAGIPAASDFYFVHSYHVVCEPAFVAARTPYAGSFVSMLQHENLFGAQFHPEKSQRLGLRLLRNFLSL
jgi:glutamine amidotransferase